jgi:hypothetical protein
VIGPLDAPRVLLLGRHDPNGRLHLVGRTTELTPTGRNAVAALLRRRHGGAAHPWPNPLPSTRWGRPGPPTAYTPVVSAYPEVVVELTVDTAVEHHRWRHPAHFIRIRAELQPVDLRAQAGFSWSSAG